MNLNLEQANQLSTLLKEKLTSPYMSVQISTLGGSEHPAVMLNIAMEKKEDWPHGYLQNTNHAMFHIDNNHIEKFSGHGLTKFRKAKFNTIEEVVVKIQKYIDENGSTAKPV